MCRKCEVECFDVNGGRGNGGSVILYTIRKGVLFCFFGGNEENKVEFLRSYFSSLPGYTSLFPSDCSRAHKPYCFCDKMFVFKIC